MDCRKIRFHENLGSTEFQVLMDLQNGGINMWTKLRRGQPCMNTLQGKELGNFRIYVIRKIKLCANFKL